MGKFLDFINESKIKEEFEENLPDVSAEQHHQNNFIEGLADYNIITDPKFNHSLHLTEIITPNEKNSKRVDVHGPSNSSGVKGIEVPEHMLHGEGGLLEFHKKTQKEFPNSDGTEPKHLPMSDGELQKSHKKLAEEHAALPKHEQIKKENEARDRLKRLGVTSILSKSEKTDTMLGMRHPKTGKPIVSAPSVKNVAGHAVYPVGKDEHHIINTCRGQTEGCGGKIDSKGKLSTMTGTCFAPHAEAQYKEAARKRARLTYASHHPHLHKDVFHATIGELREEAEKKDKAKIGENGKEAHKAVPAKPERQGKSTSGKYPATPAIPENKATGEKGGHVVVRPDNTAENDNDRTAHAVHLLNKQREEESKKDGKTRHEILINRYSKTGQEGSCYSNTGPKVKNKGTIGENVRRDGQRHRNTVTMKDANGEHIKKANGEKEDPRHQYMVNNLSRGSKEEKEVDDHLHTVRHWSAPIKDEHHTDDEKTKDEAHYDGKGKETTEDKAHSGFKKLNGRVYRYTNHHVIPKRYDENGSPADDRLFDSHHMEAKYGKREGGMFSSKGKRHGGIIMTSPTSSTNNEKRLHATFTHPVSEQAEKIKKTGVYDVDHPEKQEEARGHEYKTPTSAADTHPLSFVRNRK